MTPTGLCCAVLSIRADRCLTVSGVEGPSPARHRTRSAEARSLVVSGKRSLGTWHPAAPQASRALRLTCSQLLPEELQSAAPTQVSAWLLLFVKALSDCKGLNQRPRDDSSEPQSSRHASRRLCQLRTAVSHSLLLHPRLHPRPRRLPVDLTHCPSTPSTKQRGLPAPTREL
jgi:hypothetical protein